MILYISRYHESYVTNTKFKTQHEASALTLRTYRDAVLDLLKHKINASLSDNYDNTSNYRGVERAV